MKGIYERGHIPIVVGGTGFYIQALLYDIDFTENETDHTYRKELEQLAEEKGEEYLHKLLQEADPESAGQIHCHNVKRVIRALEFYHQTGTKISEHNEKEREKEAAYRSAYFVLTDERKRLEAVRIIQRDTRHFAKRQLTWFRRERDVIWIDKSIVGRDEDKLITFMLDQLRKKEIIR